MAPPGREEKSCGVTPGGLDPGPGLLSRAISAGGVDDGRRAGSVSFLSAAPWAGEGWGNDPRS